MELFLLMIKICHGSALAFKRFQWSEISHITHENLHFKMKEKIFFTFGLLIRTGFSNLSTSDILGQTILFCGGLPCALSGV